MNELYNRLVKEGWSYEGSARNWSSSDNERLEKRMAELKVMGNKVRIVTKKEVTEFRGGKSTNTYNVLMVLKSDAYKAEEARKTEERMRLSHEADLHHMLKNLTVQDLAWMLKEKVSQETNEELAKLETLKEHLTTE